MVRNEKQLLQAEKGRSIAMLAVYSHRVRDTGAKHLGNCSHLLGSIVFGGFCGGSSPTFEGRQSLPLQGRRSLWPSKGVYAGTCFVKQILSFLLFLVLCFPLGEQSHAWVFFLLLSCTRRLSLRSPCLLP